MPRRSRSSKRAGRTLLDLPGREYLGLWIGLPHLFASEAEMGEAWGKVRGSLREEERKGLWAYWRFDVGLSDEEAQARKYAHCHGTSFEVALAHVRETPEQAEARLERHYEDMETMETNKEGRA